MPPLPSTPPARETRTFTQPIQLVRIHTYLTMATPLLWTRQTDVIGAVGLALNAAAERDGHPEVCDRVTGLLECAGELWRASGELVDDDARLRAGRRTFQLIHLADIEVLTAHV